MKRTIILLCLILFTATNVIAQIKRLISKEYSKDATSITADDTTNPSDFDDRFFTETDKQNFKLLREYRAEKQYKLEELDKLFNNVYSEWAELKYNYERKKDLKDALDNYSKNKDQEIVTNAWQIYTYYENENTDAGVIINTVKQTVAGFRNDSLNFIKLDKIHKAIKAGLNNINNDIRLCDRSIDIALAPEVRTQSNRTYISVVFGVMVAMVIGVFFYVVFQRSGNEVSNTLLSDGGLQFVTLFILIIAIILFGILGILEGKELAAILSGISGYILGRNAKINTKDNTNSTTPPANASGTSDAASQPTQ